MLEVRMTKSGKLSFELTVIQREGLFSALCNFLEDESVKVFHLKLNSQEAINRGIYYHILDEFTNRIDFNLHTTKLRRFQIKRSEAVAIFWLLRGYDHNMALLEIKSSLHKILS